MLNLLPQTWIVLGVFIACIIVNIFFTFFNEKYRKAVNQNSNYEKAIYIINIIVMTVVLAYSVQCSVQGSYVMPSCHTFSWILTSIIIIMFFFNLGSKIYLYVVKENHKE